MQNNFSSQLSESNTHEPHHVVGLNQRKASTLALQKFLIGRRSNEAIYKLTGERPVRLMDLAVHPTGVGARLRLVMCSGDVDWVKTSLIPEELKQSVSMTKEGEECLLWQCWNSGKGYIYLPARQCLVGTRRNKTLFMQSCKKGKKRELGLRLAHKTWTKLYKEALANVANTEFE